MSTPTNSVEGKVYLVGAGPGDPGLITVKAARLLRECDVLLIDSLVETAILAHTKPGCQHFDVGKRAGRPSVPQEEIEELMIRKAREGNIVVRLKGGDPFVFGRGGEEAQRLRAAGIRFEIVPGITSAIAVPAYAGIPITHRDANTSFVVATGHEDPTKPESTLDWAKLANPHQTLVILMSVGNLRAIATRLIEHGLAPETPAAMVREGTRPLQATVTGRLDTIAAVAAEKKIVSPALLIVGKVVDLREELRWFDNGALFGKGILITRPIEQARDFADRLLERGARPLVYPTIAITEPDDPRAARDAVSAVRQYTWVAFTSRNGVDRFFAHLAAIQRDARLLGDIKIAAIGPKTKEAVEAHGLRVDLVPARSISEEVGSELIARTRTGDRVLIYGAQETRDVLQKLLRNTGRPTDVVAAYKTVFARDEYYANHVAAADIITFTSASTVNGFCENLGAHAADLAARKIVACIGPLTADQARERGLRVDVVAEDSTVEGLIAALERHALKTAPA